MSLKSLLGQQQMQEMQLQQAQQQREQEQALNDAYRTNVGPGGDVNRTALLGSLASKGMGSRIPALQKSFADADKAGLDAKNVQSQISERDFKTAKESLGVFQGMLSSLIQKPDLTHDDVIAQAAQYAQQFPQAREQAAQFVRSLPGDPRALRQQLVTMGLQSLESGKRMEMLTPKVEFKNTGKQMVPIDTNSMTNPNPQALAMTTTPGEDQSAATARAGQAITVRGQNLTDARARETNAAAVGKPFEVTDPDTGQPTLVRQDKAGNITRVDGFQPKGMGTTKLTEDQGKATGWLAQATNAFANMQAAMQSTPGSAKPGFADAIAAVPGVGQALANSLRSTDRQKFLQGSSSLGEALLRAATGAGVNKDEALQKVRELTPQFGEDDETIKQKMDAIPVYLESLKVRAGPGAKQIPGIFERAKGASGTDLGGGFRLK